MRFYSHKFHFSPHSKVDTYWVKLLAGGGKPIQCRWLSDKFGHSWQIVPIQLMEIWASEDRLEKSV